MTIAFRRGTCPALSAPMQTGDGLLVRLALTGEALTPAQLTALCSSASEHGNGMVEITARGNFQIRGLTPSSAASLADEIAAMNLNLRDGVPVETGPLAGLDPDEIADPRPLASAVRSAIDATDLAKRLGPKVSVVIDGGGRFGMSEIAADIRLVAIAHDDAAHWQIAIGGDAYTATHQGLVDKTADAVTATLSHLESIASRGPAARARDLAAETPGATSPRGRLISPPVGEMSGRTEGGAVEHGNLPNRSNLPLTGGRFAVVTALPFGSIHADLLAEFAGQAATLGTHEIRFAPARRIVLLCASEPSAFNVRTAAREAGLIVDADDPRTYTFACPGCPACASGHIPARDIAAVVVKDWADLINASSNVHISGCAKGCAHPASSTITVVGNGNRTALVVDGNARGESAASVPTADLAPALTRLAEAMRADKHDTQHLATAFAGD